MLRRTRSRGAGVGHAAIRVSSATAVIGSFIVSAGLAGCRQPVPRRGVPVQTGASTRASAAHADGNTSMIPSTYEVVELPTLGGGSSEAAAISDTGAVVGMALAHWS